MKLTLDTNVLVSAFISRRGQPAALLDAVLLFPELELILSEPILEELTDVLKRAEVMNRFQYDLRDVDDVLSQIRRVSTMVAVLSTLKVVTEDLKEDMVINTAWDRRAEYIVTGDHHLRSLKKFSNIRIVTTSTMLNIIGRRFGDYITGDL
jgi:putative PIN family toxin of toxin-antitoxin system